jgi:hypothetical protein
MAITMEALVLSRKIPYCGLGRIIACCKAKDGLMHNRHCLGPGTTCRPLSDQCQESNMVQTNALLPSPTICICFSVNNLVSTDQRAIILAGRGIVARKLCCQENGVGGCEILVVSDPTVTVVVRPVRFSFLFCLGTYIHGKDFSSPSEMRDSTASRRIGA